MGNPMHHWTAHLLPVVDIVALHPDQGIPGGREAGVVQIGPLLLVATVAQLDALAIGDYRRKC